MKKGRGRKGVDSVVSSKFKDFDFYGFSCDCTVSEIVKSKFVDNAWSYKKFIFHFIVYVDGLLIS